MFRAPRRLASAAPACLAALLLLAAVPAAVAQSRRGASIQPEAASGYTDKPGWATTRFAVAAANPLATQAGYDILKAGGSAIDAAIAVQMVLALVEPQSSGLGGGAFLLHHDGKRVEAYDGRETAPAAANEALFLQANGQPMAFYDAVVGGRSVGVPGVVSMLELAHRDHGRLPWARLFAPAIQLAEDGFKVSPRLNALLKDEKYLSGDAQAAAYFYKADGTPVDVGTVLKNPALAEVLRQIAAKGSKALMEGRIAEAMVRKVQGHATNPGQLTLADLAAYQPKKRDPICSDYSADGKAYRLCGVPPPSSGAIAIAQILGMLNGTNAASMQAVQTQEFTGTLCVRAPCPEAVRERITPTADWLHLYTEASRLAFADRDLYLGDPDFVAPPAGNWNSLLAPDYVADRARLISLQPGSQRMKEAPAGVPGPVKTAWAPMPWQVEHGTSHISITDGFGNALAMTTTIEDQFGSRLMTDGGTGKPGGFLLNNELTDFSFVPRDAAGRPVANRVEGGKRPRSSMAPTLVLDRDTGQLVMSTGSPGGALIIHFTAKTLYGVLNWGLNAQQAINLPNFAALGGPLLLESGRFSPETLQTLRDRGHAVRELPLTSGLQAIQKTPGGYFGGADPRREGVVLGD